MNSSQESSQESLAPLSQETLATTLNSIPKAIFDSFMKTNFDANLSSVEDIEEFLGVPDPQLDACMIPPPLQIPNIDGSHRQSSIPSTENMPGCFDFKVSTGPEISSKKCNYTYSSELQKLFVKRNLSCPFTFSTNKPLEGFVIRATLYFSSPENRSKVVERCYAHIREDEDNGEVLNEHIIRSSSASAVYFEELGSKRMSVTVNYENPGFGESATTYTFKFMCYTSCPGGMNRRPVSVVFTLEKGGIETYGRCKIDLKICSDPHRDKVSEEASCKRKRSFSSNTSTESSPQLIENLKNDITKLKRKADDEECLSLKVSDREEYKFLRGVQRYYRIQKLVNTHKWTPTAGTLNSVLKVLSSNSYDESD